MSGSSRRILTVGTLLLAAGLVVAGALVRTMVVDHAMWLERSYRNRWAFRDVPTRRGSICDRDGRVLVQDRPRFALDLDYDAFRRGHPCGIAIAAAALLWPGEFVHQRQEDAVRACLRLFELPARALHADASSRQIARDLRFYMSALASALSGGSRQRLARDLSAAVLARADTRVADVLGSTCADLASAMRASVARLHELAAQLREDGPVADLGQLLDAQLARHHHDRGQPLPSRLLARRLPFDVVAALACAPEAWRGFLLRPAVIRSMAESATGLVSLPSALGQVTAARNDEEDNGRVAGLAKEMIGEAELLESLPDDVDLPDEALDRLRRRAEGFLSQRVALGGRFGRSGVEAEMEGRLAGQPGWRLVERDASAREQLLYHTLDVNPGHDVRVTIDARLQEVLERVLDAHQRGLDTAMVVIDAGSGDVLAMGGRPLQIQDPSGRLVDRTVAPVASWRNAGHIGSLAKPFVLLEQLAAERAGDVTSHADFVPCARHYKRIPGTSRWLACDHVHGDEGREPALAIAKSCNVFFFQAAERLGMAGLRRAYARAGWFELPGEGTAPPYQRAVRGISRFSRPQVDPAGQALQHVGIGYGVKANALSVARAYAGLATGRLPTLGLIAGEARPSVDLGIPGADLALVHDGLRRCILQGTAQDVDGLLEFGVHGKTGTAEVNEANENNAWFAGFVLAPTGRPTLAFAAVAYKVDDLGKESARMVADFLRGLVAHREADTLRRRWLEGEGE